MKYGMSKIIVAAIFAAGLGVQADARAASKSIIVESPSDLPELAQRDSQAMYLHETGDGRAILYVEQDQGRTLAIFDVSHPTKIRALKQVSVTARAPYDFVRSASDSEVLIHYRDHSGFALINFKKYNQPLLIQTPELQHPADVQGLGSSSLLLASTTHPSAQPEDPEYQVIDVSNPSDPDVSNVSGVTQTLERAETGTLFLLSNNGLTVVRRPNVEQEHWTELAQQTGN